MKSNDKILLLHYLYTINYGSKLHLDRILCYCFHHRPPESYFSWRHRDIHCYHELYIRLFKDRF